MSKILVLAALFAATYWYMTRKNKSEAEATKAPPKKISKNLKACEYCQVNIPESEGIERSGHFFCCEEHAEAYFSKTK